MSRVTGSDEIVRKLKAAGQDGARALAAGLFEEGLAILSESVLQVPVDTGRLRSSQYCAPPEMDGRRVRVELGYGTDYAVPVHERLEARHPTGKAKYLQDPTDAARGGFADRVAGRAKRYFVDGAGPDSVAATAPSAPGGK